MSTPKYLKEARDALAELEGQRALLLDEAAAAKARRAPLQAAVDRAIKRGEKRRILVNSSGSFIEATVSNVAVNSYDLRGLLDKRPREVLDAIVGGEVKLSLGGNGITYKLRGLVQRARVPSDAAMREYKRASRALLRAELASQKAREAKYAAIRAAYEGGEKVDQDVLAAEVAATTMVRIKRDRVPLASEAERKAGQMDAWEGAPLRLAKQHLNYMEAVAGGRGGTPDECPCANCAKARRENETAAARLREVEQLPTAMGVCPEHGRHRMHLGRSPERYWEAKTLTGPDGTSVELPEGRRSVPTVTCIKGVNLVAYIYLRELARELAREDKDAARAARKAVAFTCPNLECGEDVTATPNRQGFVECPVCGVGLDTATIRTRKAA